MTSEAQTIPEDQVRSGFGVGEPMPVLKNARYEKFARNW